jgi:hypothetical protein
MEPAGSGATWTGSPKGVFAERKHHKLRQGEPSSFLTSSFIIFPSYLPRSGLPFASSIDYGTGVAS